MQEDGAFPFGQTNSVRPARLAATTPRAAVVGVYPSAWHISWRAPLALRPLGRTGAVTALAVDVEPTVFWDGATDDFAARLAGWRESVGFREGDAPGLHGHVSATSPSTNGSSGRKVVDRYLRPLGLKESSAAFTDICPVFFVKYGSGGGRREQGDAIRDEYDPIAREMGLMKSTLPARPTAARLPRLAAARFAGRIVSDLAESSAELVITLGPEVWNTLVLIPQLRARPPVTSFKDLYGLTYGSMGTLQVAGRTVDWLPLVHPGLLRGGEIAEPGEDVDPTRRTSRGWNVLHSRWAVTQQARSRSREVASDLGSDDDSARAG